MRVCTRGPRPARRAACLRTALAEERRQAVQDVPGVRPQDTRQQPGAERAPRGRQWGNLDEMEALFLRPKSRARSRIAGADISFCNRCAPAGDAVACCIALVCVCVACVWVCVGPLSSEPDPFM